MIALDIPRVVGVSLLVLALGARVQLVALQRQEHQSKETETWSVWSVLGF